MKIAITIHITTIILAFGVSFWILGSAKGTRQHRILGWLFTIFLGLSALSSFWIQTWQGFSFIHLLSVATLYWLIRAIVAVRLKSNNWLYDHSSNMGSAYIAIIIAGAGVLVRHYFMPENVLMGGIASTLTACLAIPLLIKITAKHKKVKFFN